MLGHGRGVGRGRAAGDVRADGDTDHPADLCPDCSSNTEPIGTSHHSAISYAFAFTHSEANISSDCFSDRRPLVQSNFGSHSVADPGAYNGKAKCCTICGAQSSSHC